MGYLIVRVNPAASTDSGSEEEPLVFASVRAPLGDHTVTGDGWERLTALLSKHGYEVRPEFGSYSPKDWPFTAVAYTSKSKDGFGRSGSSLYRFPCRKKESA